MKKIKLFTKLYIVIAFLMCSKSAVFGQNTFPATGSVGIGTSSPTTKLEVVSDNTFLRLRGTDYAGNTPLDILNLGFQGSTGGMNLAFRVGYPYGNGVNSGIKLDLIKLSNGNTIFGTSEQNTSLGNIGIGTNNPQAKLHVTNTIMASDPNYPSINVRMDGTGIPIIRFSRDGDGNRTVYHNAFIGQFWNTSLSSYSLGIGTGSSGNGDANANNTVITIPLNGNVGIGTINPVAKLTVNGNLRATEIRVMTDVSIPDYVFENTYNLRSLSQVETFIKANKHLPEIPSAAEIKENGLDVAEMDALLLKKIEELTLYMIEIKKENEEIKKENSEIKKKNELLDQEIQLLKN